MTSVYEDKDPNALGLAEELSQVSCQDELDFAYLFEYDPPCVDFTGEQDEPSLPPQALSSPSSVAYPLEEVAYDIKSCSHSPYGDPTSDGLVGCEHHENRAYLGLSRPAGLALSPRIEITPSREHYNHGRDSLQAHPVNISPRPTLTVPGHECLAYREPQCLSPASSNSSTSWHSESFSPWASPCVSPSGGHTAGDLCPRLQNIHTGSPRTSPGTSPRTSITEDSCQGPRSPSPRPGSRSTSPQGKRTYEMYKNPSLFPGPRSRSPSPHGGHEDPNGVLYSHSGALVDGLNGFNPALSGSNPAKIIKTSNATFYRESQPEPYLVPPDLDMKTQSGAEPFFVIPPMWPNHVMPGICRIPVASLPPLEWPLPTCTDQYELRIEMQPKQHHRAHYETEGSRGAVKAPTGGHPVVQLHGYKGKEPLGLQIFIGTADERILKPHAFYQVHRITGKTVTTTSYEKVINSTKVLEIPLEPKNNMRAMIDCAGILKLRNADIELRKGETDIGRKNTRVRLVFRVHIPQPGGQHVSLQAASHAIECSQRSAHELPMVETQDTDNCSVLGGQQMILSGQNFTADSKVVFIEKTHDGQQIWEVEATVDKDKSQANMLFVEIPPYRDRSVCHAAKVNFYVINGKRKRSQPQHFTYTPLAVPSIKTEPVDEYESGSLGFVLPQALGMSPQSFYSSPRGLIHTDNCLVSCQQGRSSLPGPDSRYQQQSPAIVYPRGAKGLSGSPALYQQPPGGGVPDPHRSVLVHTGSPAQPPTMGAPPHGSPSSQPSSIIQFSPTNHLLRGGAPPPTEPQPILYCEGYPQGVTATARSPAPAQVANAQQYPTVIQQQPYVQKMTKNRASPGQMEPQRCSPSEEQRPSIPGRVTVKQENLDQAYLDDVNEIIRKDLTGIHGRAQT
ncbi:LOW QUALITY PROTEIN: nuclear factor of activated T-cells, cytoplasmic 2 [Brienomyrus brachyistius]|uniref:LOW QUALITY PROTEIN: nuclear factor of activated T-cells, cytoplasmic 2 n=1 Tax=Brienomyrus brachyistius TaxID=42636 RepID=UPI0020B1D2C9|nr:LOW QUALITY PROTEIN: nuclear factor of activated T-cells, cytoplasmic 2 [Brienomyrus brachyistius]